MISRATETRFVCTLPVTSRCTQLSLNPVLRRMCVSTPSTPLTTARELLQAPVSTVTSDCVITAVGKHSARYCYGFNFNTETCCSTWWYWCCQCDTVALAVSSAPRMSEKPLQHSYNHAEPVADRLAQ